MSAKVLPLPAGSPNSAPPSFNATLNPNPAPPASYQFSLTDGEGKSVANLVVLDDTAATTTISITLEDGASFSAEPLVWSVPPCEGAPAVAGSGNAISFEVSKPKHLLHPWVFRFVVDALGVAGIRSQNIYLVKPFDLLFGPIDPPQFALKYSPADGNFKLEDYPNSDQEGVVWGKDLFMINTQLPFTFFLHLLIDPPTSSEISFAADPICWSSGVKPKWITVSPHPPAPDKPLKITIDSSGRGHSVGLQFAVEIATGGQPIKILSPDPILINATIGDG